MGLSDDAQNHAGPSRSWSTTSAFLVELCEWAAALPVEQLPPREGDAARHFARTTRTIGRWLSRAGIDGWDGFLRYWSFEMRRPNAHDGSPPQA
jgi:hypothetical protein